MQQQTTILLAVILVLVLGMIYYMNVQSQKAADFEARLAAEEAEKPTVLVRDWGGWGGWGGGWRRPGGPGVWRGGRRFWW